MKRIAALGVLLCVLGGSLSLDAQVDPRLKEAVRLAQAGLGDSARAVTARLLANTLRTDALFAEVLFTQGLVAGTLEDRRRSLQRVTIEYSLSDWADNALLLLGQLEYATDSPSGAIQYFARLLDDYPLSPLRATAGFWGARAAYESRQAAQACRMATRGLEAVGDDLELRNQLRFQLQRCQAAVSRDSSRQPVVTPPPPPPPTGPIFRVQTAALRTQAAADQVIGRLKELGYEAITVEQGGFFKVQAGPFRSRDDAGVALRRIQDRFGQGPFIVVTR